MDQRDNILQELKELNSQLTADTRQNTYAVPAGYFEDLIGQVISRIKALEAVNAVDELDHLSPVLGKLSKQTPYSTPTGYFEGLEERVLQAIGNSKVGQSAKEETESLSPLLAGLKKDLPYSVPQGYFESLEPVKEHKTTAKVISLVSRKWLRYAAAAIVTGIIIVVAFLGFSSDIKNENRSVVRFEKKLNKEIKKMSDQELNEFIELTNDGIVGDEKVSNNTSEEIKELLKDVPDTELQEFLEETSVVNNDEEDASMLN